jgi:VWFA-related protein
MRKVVVLLAIALAGAALDAQQTPRTIGAASGPTTTVDFLAIDAKGRPVTDLTAGDVTLKLDGKTRVVRSLEFVKRDAAAPVAAAAPAAAPAAPPVNEPPPSAFGTNVAGASAGRVVYIIFDSDTMATGRELRVKDAMNVYLNNLGPRDQVSIITVPRGGVSTPLTSDLAKVRAVVSQLRGSAATSGETTDEATCRSRLTVQAVTGILETRANAATPTDVIFVASNLFGPRQTVSIGAQASGGRAGMVNAGGCEFANEEFTRLGTAAISARARFYIIRPEDGVVPTVSGGNSNTRGSDNPLVGLENISGITGGPMWFMAGTDEPSFLRIAHETSGYYVATVELDAADPSAPLRALSVKTTRPDVVIRARPSVAFARASASGPKLDPKDMLKVGTVHRDVPLRVSAYAMRKAAAETKVRIMAIADGIGPNAKFSAASIALYNSAGTRVAQWSANAAELAAPVLVAPFDQEPGKYRVRVAATDAAGRGGTADFDLDATLTPAAGKLSLSSIMLGTADGGFAPKLQFGAEPQAVAYFELYGGAPGMPVTVAMELATSMNGQAIAQIKPQIGASNEPDKFTIMAPIALGPLPPGTYVVRAIVGLDGQPATRITRTLVKGQ